MGIGMEENNQNLMLIWDGLTGVQLKLDESHGKKLSLYGMTKSFVSSRLQQLTIS